MRAMAIDDFGTVPTLHDLPAPVPGEGEIRVRVLAASVNGFDLAVVGGLLRGLMPYAFPIVLGKDFAGTVDVVGPGVTDVAVGDVVFGVLMKPELGDGTFADLVTVPAENIAPIPAGVDPVSAAASALAGTAALAAVDAISPAKGERVLVAGATGGVGAFAVQMASERGASVIATARPGAEEAFVRSLGADETVDRRGNALMALRPDGVHSVVHLAGDPLELTEVVDPGGRFASTLGFGAEEGDLYISAVMATPNRITLDRLAVDLAAGRLVAPVQRTYTLDQVPQALSDFADGKLGKLVVRVA
jgi:NADPH:quinone reductase-like Zn-dependent oxidoreductase